MIDFGYRAYLPLKLGKVVATKGAVKALKDARMNAMTLLVLHASGDWGDLSKEDCEANNMALLNGDRILSAYTVGKQKVWIITEADRSVTTILLPSEY